MLPKFNLLVYDFDGVLTDNTVYVDQNGIETVRVNRADGLAISILKNEGFTQLILSTEKNPVVSKRAEKLEIPVIQGSESKLICLKNYCNTHNINLKTVLYIGNDINDYEVMTQVGYKVCPADAHISIIEISDMILSSKGGYGVIREFYDVLNKEGKQ
jgi:3-deoxy-D-manno-octulosonate 8-phosphate phosphatase (KDO 8-P phosphatase)